MIEIIRHACFRSKRFLAISQYLLGPTWVPHEYIALLKRMPSGSHRRREARLVFERFYYKVESNKYVARAGQAIHEQSLSMSGPGTAMDIRRTTNEVYETSLLIVARTLQARS